MAARVALPAAKAARTGHSTATAALAMLSLTTDARAGPPSLAMATERTAASVATDSGVLLLLVAAAERAAGG